MTGASWRENCRRNSARLRTALTDPLGGDVADGRARHRDSQHAQVPVTQCGRFTPEVSRYLVFVEAQINLWKQGQGNNHQTMFAGPEMGSYAEGGAGCTSTWLPPAWPDAMVLRCEVGRARARA